MSQIDPRADAPLLDWSELGVSELLPTGTVTLLLADVEGSTRLWESQPEQMTAAFARLDHALFHVVSAHGGVRPVEQGEGDSFVAAFARASDAVACAQEFMTSSIAALLGRWFWCRKECARAPPVSCFGPMVHVPWFVAYFCIRTMTWLTSMSYLLYQALSRIGLNPSLTAADVPDTRLIELVDGPHRLERGRALDLGCGAGRKTLYLACCGWEATGIDIIARAIDKSRSRAVGAAASARFNQGDVSRLGDLEIGENYNLIIDSGCYYGLTGEQRGGFATGVTRVAAPDALLLMAGFTKLPGGRGINEGDLRRRFPEWEIRATVPVPIDEIMRHTRIPLPMKALMRHGRLQIRRFELSRRH